MIPYSSLTDAQREQVAQLFYDDLFGTDPAHFEYLVKDGAVCSRYRSVTVETGDRIHAHKPRNVETRLAVREVEGGNPTDVIKSIARSVVERMAQAQDAQA